MGFAYRKIQFGRIFLRYINKRGFGFIDYDIPHLLSGLLVQRTDQTMLFSALVAEILKRGYARKA